MPLDPSIILSQKPLEPLEDIQRKRKKADLDLATGQQRQQMNELQIANQKIANLSQRERARLESSILGLARTKSFLDAGDTQGAENYLLSRRQELGRRIAAGENVDVTETDRGLQMLKDDPEAFKRLADAGVNLGFQSGILQRPRGSFATSAMKNQQALQDAIGSGDTFGATAIARTLGMIGEGQQLDIKDGQVVISELTGFGKTKAGVGKRVEREKVKGKEFGKAQAEALINLPQIEQQANTTINLIDSLIRHPGLAAGIGVIEANTPTLREQTADFERRREQIQGRAFLQAFETLKGGGQITEREGEAATAALARAQAAQSEEAFIEAMLEFRDILQGGIERARSQASGNFESRIPQSQESQTTNEFEGFEVVE